MVKYPYKEGAVIDKPTFELLAGYFDLVPNYQNIPAGYRIFIYDEKKVRELPPEELLAISPYLYVYNGVAFDCGKIDREEINKRRVKELFNLMREKGITKDSFLDAVVEFEFSQLGEESAQPLSEMAYTLDSKEDSLHSYSLIDVWFDIWLERNRKNKEKCAEANKGREKPFELERILKIGYEPVAIDYASDGRLYVLDKTGKVHEFEQGEKTSEWQVRCGIENDFYRDDMEEMFSPVFPNISVQNRILFLTNGSTLERHDLKEEGIIHPRQLQKHTGAALKVWTGKEIGENDLWFHDVCLKEGNVFVSASLRTNVRYILQITDEGKHRVVYQGDYPREMGSNNLQDLTLRLGLFNAGLYFPEGNGISLLTEEGPKEMLKGYKRDEVPNWNVDPITKFAFGRDFMVASGRVKDFEMPMFQVFRPIYESEGLIRVGETPQPSRFERVHVTDIPKNNSKMIKELSISAHEDQFALSHSSWNRVFVYRMKD